MIREYIYFVDDNPNGTSGMTDEEIVRCKECRYWNTKGCRDGVGECEWAYYMTKPDDYCSYGEREGE